MVFGEDDQIWADLEKMTLESGTDALTSPTEFHRWNDLPTEMLLAVINRMEFKSLMQLRGTNRVMKDLVESQIYDFESLKFTYWANRFNDLHFYAEAKRRAEWISLTLENDLFDRDYGFVPYSHVLQCLQHVLKYGRIRKLEVCYVPRHNFSEESVDEGMGDLLEQLALSAPFRFSNFALDGIDPQVASFFLHNCTENVEGVYFFHDGPDRAGALLNADILLIEPKFINAESITIMYLKQPSYSEIGILMAKKWIENGSKIGQTLMVAASPLLPVKTDPLQCFDAEFSSDIIYKRENEVRESGELRMRTANREKHLLIWKVKAAFFLVVIPSCLRDSEIPTKFRREIEWTQCPDRSEYLHGLMIAR